MSGHSSASGSDSQPAAPPDDRFLDEALLLLHFAYREITAEPDRILARRGLGRVHHRILYMCRRKPGLSVGELLQILEISKQALHRPLGELVRLRLLLVTPDPADRRTRRLRPTAAGLRLEERLSGLQREAFARAFAGRGAAAEQSFAQVMLALGNGKAATAFADGPQQADMPGRSARRK